MWDFPGFFLLDAMYGILAASEARHFSISLKINYNALMGPHNDINGHVNHEDGAH